MHILLLCVVIVLVIVFFDLLESWFKWGQMSHKILLFYYLERYIDSVGTERGKGRDPTSWWVFRL